MGKLIATDQHCFLVFENKKACIAHAERQSADRLAYGEFARLEAIHWSLKLGCRVWHSKLEDIFLVLEKSGELMKVLHGNRVGWICNFGSSGVKEIT